MAQVTKTIRENSGDNLATWALIANGTNVTATGTTVTVAVPTIQAQYTYSGKAYASANIDDAILQIGKNTNNRVSYSASYQTWASGAKKTLTRSKTSVTVNTSSIFDSTNKTTRNVSVYLNSNSSQAEGYVSLSSGSSSDSGDTTGAYTGYTGLWGSLASVTLNAPPTFNFTQVTFDTNYVYKGLTTASVTISGLSAKYGGDISEVKLTIGNQSATRTNNGTLSILLGAEGTFTPTVTVTDSRGQVTTKTLDAITVNGYTAPAVSFSVQRSLANGVPADEGTYGAISADFTFTDAIADLTQPTVAVDGTTASVTWYASRASDGSMSGTVDWSTLSSPTTVYGIVDAPNIQVSYQITVTPNDSISSGTPITQTLASAFYTIDFLAGGHGIAFGQPSTEDGFFCNMDSHFKDHANIVRALFDFIHPVGSYYETSDTSFNPNTTWGGTWELETEGLVHIGAGSTYSVGDTGGEKTHTLTIDEMPSHTHTFAYAQYGRGTGSSTTSALQYSGSTKTTDARGGGQAHNIMQPYIVVNRWHRTA